MTTKLRLIKVVHTIIWVLFNLVLGYMLYAVWVNRIDVWVWVCIGIIVGEGLVLMLFKYSCPLTVLARRYSNSEKHNFDIYLPEWLAKYNKLIYTSIFVLALLGIVYRLLTGQ